MSAAEIRDELADCDAVGEAIEDRGIVQAASGDAAVVFGVRASDASEGQWVIGGLRFVDARLRRLSEIAGGLYSRMILECDFFGVLQSERLSFLRRCDSLLNGRSGLARSNVHCFRLRIDPGGDCEKKKRDNEEEWGSVH